MLITALLMTGVLAGASATAPLGDDPDTVVSTAPATAVILDGATAPVAPEVGSAGLAAQSADPHGLSTDDQIARWLAARTPGTAADESPVWRDDRKPHGEVSVGVGTGGYRDYAAAVSLPIGENGRLDLSVRQTENGYPYGYGSPYGYEGYGRDPYFNDGGYAFPGAPKAGQAAEYEARVRRPDGPPGAWREPRPEQPATQ
ncbi:hypothetical protein GGQ87_002011 [Brevundimonas alba]|uniref:Uncharacterized protein n=1 Tax=Brevundimonas alba TaxID=74314 RepID=A0A7X6BN39_9CAUL|nr:hypothetical protein [Brevundimonas alba]NJC41753.1 hypothetical protein [Brevundimonas alba]